MQFLNLLLLMQISGKLLVVLNDDCTVNSIMKLLAKEEYFCKLQNCIMVKVCNFDEIVDSKQPKPFYFELIGKQIFPFWRQATSDGIISQSVPTKYEVGGKALEVLLESVLEHMDVLPFRVWNFSLAVKTSTMSESTTQYVALVFCSL